MCRRTHSRRPGIAARAVFALVFVTAVGSFVPTRAYQQYGVQVGSKVVPLKWNRLPVQYYIANRGISTVSVAQIQAAVASAFATWEAVPTATLTSQFAGLTNAQPTQDDGLSTLGFLDDPSEPDVLGSTDWLLDDTTGEIVEADIFFNTAVPWSVASGGQKNAFDLESIALHEIGHFWGLGHSALGETTETAGGRDVIAIGAVMFPIALSPGNVKGRVLQPDDIAGISDLYPATSFNSETGSVTGRVEKNGTGVFGAHIVAYNPATGKMVGNFSQDQSGNFSIAGLDVGPVILRVEPVDDADLDGFFDDTTIPLVDLNFKIAYHPRLVVVPAGGASSQVVIQVTPK